MGNKIALRKSDLPACDVEYIRNGYWGVTSFFQITESHFIRKRKIFFTKQQGFNLLQELYETGVIKYDEVTDWWDIIVKAPIPLIHHELDILENIRPQKEKDFLWDVGLVLQGMKARDKATAEQTPQIVAVTNSLGILTGYIITSNWRSPVFDSLKEGIGILKDGIKNRHILNSFHKLLMDGIQAMFNNPEPPKTASCPN